LSSVRWLHLSDLHVGMREQGWLWPRYGTQLFEDLARIFDKAGPWDAVLFSGDMVNKGDPAEFAKLDEIIGRIWEKLSQLGCKPILITTPGNHDLSRVDSMTPEMIALEHYWSKPELRADVWKPDSRYKKFIDDRFSSYMNWRRRSIDSGIHLSPTKEGLLPGDACYTFEVGSEPVGLISLNSTWLQLGAGDYVGLLDVDARQLMAITNNDPDAWASSHRVNFLMTHQPTSWLHSDSLDTWNSEINPTGRFDVHLFGHMHEPILSRIAHGGSAGRRLAQSASLFGLEKLSDGSTQRIQGYAAFSLTKSGSTASLRCWPRIVVKTGDSDRRLAADTTQDLAEDNSFSFTYETNQPLPLNSADASAPLPIAPVKILESSSFDVNSIRVTMPDIRAHSLVREVAQLDIITKINVNGAVWLTADWGMAAHAFIASVLPQLAIDTDSVFRLDCSDYIDRESFMIGVGASLGSSFENIFTTISNHGSSIVVLDDIPIVTPDSSIEGTSASEVEKFVVIIQDYAPEAKIILRTRVNPIGASLPAISLEPFDEADLALYVRESELGGARYSKPDSVGIIYRRTDGVPARVDEALRDLQVTSLTDLAATNPDFAETAIISVDAPASLVMAIDHIKTSTDNDAPRSYELLLALSALPYGEQLSRIRRFLGVHPFTTNHARYLLDRGLLTSVTLSGMGENEDAEQVRALSVPRIVREYVISIMPDEKIRAIDRSLVTMYFGDK
jgi:predicted phosphodiesterase